MRIAKICKWGLFAAGMLAMYFSFALMFLVPGVLDESRIVLTAGSVSLAANLCLLSGILFSTDQDNSLRTMKAILRSPPVVVFLIATVLLILSTTTSTWRR